MIVERSPQRLWPEGAGVSDSAAVPRPAASSFMPLRHSPQHPRQRRWWFARTEQPPWIEQVRRLAERSRCFARAEQPLWIRLMGCSAQRVIGVRHQFRCDALRRTPRAAGSANLGSDPKNSGDSRGAEYPVGLILQPSSQPLTLTRPPTYMPLICRHFRTDRMSKALQKPRRQHGC